AANLIDHSDIASSSPPGGFATATTAAKRFWAKRARWLKNPELVRKAINREKEKKQATKQLASKEDGKSVERVRVADNVFAVRMEEEKKRRIVLEAQNAFRGLANRIKAFVDPAPEPDTLRFVPAIVGMASGLIAGAIKSKPEPSIVAPKDLELKPSLTKAVNDDDTLADTILPVPAPKPRSNWLKPAQQA